MTKEEVIKFLELDKNDRGKCFISDAIDIAIKALEQQSSDDCVSRKQALSAIRNLYPSTPFVRINLKKWQEENKKYFECEDIIKALPPVTPTHVICKDCSHYDPLTCNSGTCLNPNMQWSNEVSATHYCADFEKRGNEK